MEIVGFDRDEDNYRKNIGKHNVFDSEAEQIFFNHPLVGKRDFKHFQTEERFYALGSTYHDRLLFIDFTIRSDKIRVISAREMTNGEVRVYEDSKKRTS